ncbi:uncharacterized protein EAF01_007666 [Botrytis porri]|uniref:Uncharacterized protein n=1 Tax=Botrytis porri TaxID=87229 RepID=A0A4Z1KEA5_9HELO|nr:uncharacterized protein EAF01_007666 [Botrytis porri]KAF7900364.1 hypothetical protein EAF01_007666 [Botrytis porri]TGO84513.1 hypothetical protein BPOR_0496g00050 [Botrytis porri]
MSKFRKSFYTVKTTLFDLPFKQITQVMEDSATSAWNIHISSSDLSKLKTGFEAPDMDHRWEITPKGADENGIIYIHISRSWTEEDHFIFAVKPNDGEGAEIVSITWDRNEGEVRRDEEYAKKEVVMVCRMVLKCEFETRPFSDRQLLWSERR